MVWYNPGTWFKPKPSPSPTTPTAPAPKPSTPSPSPSPSTPTNSTRTTTPSTPTNTSTTSRSSGGSSGGFWSNVGNAIGGAYTSVDKAVGGILPGGATNTVGQKIGSAYTAVDKKVGGILPGGYIAPAKNNTPTISSASKNTNSSSGNSGVTYGFNNQVGNVTDTSGNTIGTVNIAGGIAPTPVSTNTSTSTVTKDPVNVYYSTNKDWTAKDPNSITIWTDKRGAIVGDSRADIDIPVGLNLKGQYEYGGKKGSGYDILAYNLKDITKTGTQTTTTTNYGYDFGGLRTASFTVAGTMPEGQYGPAKPVIQTVAYKPGDMLAVNQAGEVGVFEFGSTLPKGSTWINEKGERLYGDIGSSGRTANEVYTGTQANIQATTGVKRFGATGMDAIASAFTWSDPLKLGSAFQLVDLGVDTLTQGKTKAWAEWESDTKRIQTNTYTSIYSGTGQGYRSMGSWVATSPPVVTTALIGAGAVVGGVVSQAGLAITTVPSIATSSAVSWGVAHSGAIATTAITVGTPLIAYGVGSHISNVNSTIRGQGGDWADVAGRISYEGVNMVAFGSGMNWGIKNGLPLQYRGVQIEGNTVSQGVYNAWTGKPIYTKSLSGIGEGGKLSYTSYGTGTTGKMINYNQLNLQNAYTPSGKIETSLYLENVKTYGTPGINVQSAYGVTSFTYGTKANVYQEDYLKSFFKNKGLNDKTTNALNDYFKNQKSYEVYGSTATKAQTAGYRLPKDVDVVFFKDTATAKAQEIANIINLNQGRTVVTKNGMTFYLDKTVATVPEGTGQIMVNNVKMFDVHGTDIAPQFMATVDAFGFKKLNPTKIGGISSSQLSMEGANKLASVGSLQPSGMVGPDMVRRAKDMADFYVIQKELIQVKGGAGSISTATDLTTNYYNSVVSSFGEGSFSNYPKLFAYSSPSVSTSFSSASLAGSSLGLLASPSPSPSRSFSFSPGNIYLASRPSASIVSLSPSISASPSRSPSPSPSRSFSFSPSASMSPSPSPSLSLSLSPSMSPSMSPSPSLSPSLSPSPYFVPPPLVFFKAGGWNDLGSNILKGGKRKTAYVPSFSALVFKQFGTYKKGALAKTGLDYRPITKQWSVSTKKGGFKFKL